MAQPEQSLAKHARWIPAWHFIALPILLVNVLIVARRMYYAGYSRGSIWEIAVAIALVVGLFYSRVMPLTAQDRVIRLEERLRMQERLPADMRGRMNDLTPGQLVGLRFASDEEIPDLARRCLSGELKTRNDVKKAIKTWRPDYLRV